MDDLELLFAHYVDVTGSTARRMAEIATEVETKAAKEIQRGAIVIYWSMGPSDDNRGCTPCQPAQVAICNAILPKQHAVRKRR